MDLCIFNPRLTTLTKSRLSVKYLTLVKPTSKSTISLSRSRKQSTSAVYVKSGDRQRKINHEPIRANAKSLSDLKRLPTSILVRSLVLGKLFATPFLFEPAFHVFKKIANSRSRVLNVDSNPLLRTLIKPLIYDQFCAGRDELEVAKTREKIRSIGYSGVILCYGKEVVVDASDSLLSTGKSNARGEAEITEWRDGNLKTLDMIGLGDWLGLK
jgi:proline dehydrogenase